MSNAGVHAAHCCARHGCKYGDDDCPVVVGTVEQLYQCEECSDENSRLDAAMRKAVALGVMADTPDMRSSLRDILDAAYNADY
ncbi:hypothetical protein ACTO5A_22940 [Pseudomonas aeruginosa]|uniref:hypothetical protein n=1 Tax=Pseudomonas aeruginosa TaxID=287 RepID=UPI002FE5810E